MIIDFEKIAEQTLENFKGGEKAVCAKMYVDDLHRIMMLKLEPGASIGMHTHDTGSEIAFILHGTGTALYDDGEEPLSPGICHYCPKGHSHSIRNTGTEDLIFYAVVD
jgi:mannose-6-phosphate isomerase-like protein (cupin superfamily)